MGQRVEVNNIYVCIYVEKEQNEMRMRYLTLTASSHSD